jgi:hypothetical protein
MVDERKDRIKGYENDIKRNYIIEKSMKNDEKKESGNENKM